MPLNYSKWDQLELSDDSDIEGHPNVDKRSLIRWKQRDIHEKREQRKTNIQHLHAQIACDTILLGRITDISKRLSDSSASPPAPIYFSNLVEQLQTNPSRECPPGNDPSKLEHTYDGMLHSLLHQVGEAARKKIKEAGVPESEREEKLSKELASAVAEHVVRLGDTITKNKKELASEEAEQKKHITSDDIHEGFESKYVPPPAAPEGVPVKPIDKPKKKAITTEFEVLNPKAASSSSAPAAPTVEDEDEEVDELPELTPSLEAFAKLPVGSYEKSFEFIQAHRDVVVPGATDALLVAAFQAQSEGKAKYAKQCVHQSLLLQYCEKLGPDGVRVFFRKMMSGDKRAEKVFVDDFNNTYNHLVSRVRISQEEAEASGGKEQIQLVPENPNQQITFNVPDGPPPEELKLEGPGTEDMDIEEVRKALQLRWDIYESFPKELQEALKIGELEAVNKVLGDLDVPVAEEVVEKLDTAGILSFAEGGIRDETGTGKGN
ncbi:hsp90-like protein [Crucibulum laeve]|uniref:Hsp90 chaperone protein kinase-targeting subunit n=1 Tax=Crucibulum laeve TaxID=68775 RepID=A0A5C3M5Z4_9AGAR|nr:hsp90-like protein [Crucibulum laeve]